MRSSEDEAIHHARRPVRPSVRSIRDIVNVFLYLFPYYLADYMKHHMMILNIGFKTAKLLKLQF